jgi:hypothetical protein
VLTILPTASGLRDTFRGVFVKYSIRKGATSKSSAEGPMEKIDSSKRRVKSKEVFEIDSTNGPKLLSAVRNVEFAILLAG